MITSPTKKFNLLLAIILSISFLAPPSVSARPGGELATLALSQLGASDLVLHGPYDTGRIRFSLPADWALQDGAQIQILVSAFFADNEASLNPAGYVGASLDVYFNGDLQQSIALVSGANLIYQVPINPGSLTSKRADGSLEISFFLNAAVDCESAFRKTTVSISATSQLSLPYVFSPLAYDLRRLPWPIYQPGLTEAVPAVVVVPENASEAELRAAMLVMAGLGRMTSLNLPVSLITVNQFTEAVRNEANLIFVGKPAGLVMLTAFELPVPITDFLFFAPGIQPADGVIEIIPSPWAAGKSALIISGNSDEGVVKAAQAFTTQNLQTGDTRSSVVIANVNPLFSPGVLTADSQLLTSADVTLSDLGYGLETQSSLGANWFTYQFIIPPGDAPTDSPYFDLSFSNSALVDVARSGVALYMNEQLVGSAAFVEGGSNYVTARINLPLSGFVSGFNQIDIVASLIPRDLCSVFTTNGLWFTVYPESALHLSLAASVATEAPALDLSSYPAPFISDPNLASTTFIVSPADSGAWKVAADLAYDLGDSADGSVLSLNLIFGGPIAQLPIAGQNLIVVGKPIDLPMLTELAEVLPARFEPGSNVAILEGQQVTYRFSADKALGYLEMLAAPWDTSATILTVLGTSDAGLTYAANALTTSKLRTTLSGNFASLDEDRISVVDTRSGVGMGRPPSDMLPGTVIEETPEAAPPIEFDPVENKAQQTILFGIWVVVGLMAVVIVVALFLRGRNPSAK